MSMTPLSALFNTEVHVSLAVSHICSLNRDMQATLSRCATISSGRSLRSKGPTLSLEQVNSIVCNHISIKLTSSSLSSDRKSSHFGGTVCVPFTEYRQAIPDGRCENLLESSSRGIVMSKTWAMSGICAVWVVLQCFYEGSADQAQTGKTQLDSMKRYVEQTTR